MTAEGPFVYTYRLGGITFQVKSDLRLSGFLADKFRHFNATQAQPDVVCRINGLVPGSSRLTTGDLALAEQLIPWLPRETRLQPCPLLHSTKVKAALRDAMAHPEALQVELRPASITVTNLARRRMDVFYQGDHPAFADDTRHLDSGILLPFLPMYDATLLHSSGVVCGGTAGLFLAPDDGGKTTVAGLIHPDDAVMSDDQNLVRKLGGRFYAFGLPWCRVLGSTGHHPLGGLFFLEKASAFDLIPLAPFDALERIALDPQNAYGPLPPAHRTHAVSLRLELVRQVPAYRLRFSRDDVDWDAVAAAMRAPTYA
jgi:hypothetical protein